MAKFTKVTPDEAKRIRELTLRIGDLRLRTILTPERVLPSGETRHAARLLRPERLSHLNAGTGRLTEAERQALARVWSNRVAIGNLGKRGDKLGHKEFKTNRAIRTWLMHGKTEPQRRRKDDAELRAIKALRLLGIDPDDGIYYLRGVTTA